MNYQQRYLNNIIDKIQDTINYINLLSSPEDEHTDEDIEILNNSKQSIPCGSADAFRSDYRSYRN